MFFNGYGMGFSLFNLMSVVILVMFVVVFVKAISQWNKNNHAPRLTVEAKIVGKRASHRHHDSGSSTRYYVTFEVESGDRMELHVMGTEYGLLVEGDKGNLSFQGTRYLGFERM